MLSEERFDLFETTWERSHTRLSVMLQQDHLILSHREDRVNTLLRDPRLHLKVNYICLPFMHDCVPFQWTGFCFLESTFDFQRSTEIVLSPGNADIPTTLHLNSLGMILCVFPKCTKGLSSVFQITDVLNSQGMQEETQSERSVSPELSPSLLGFQHNLRPN